MSAQVVQTDDQPRIGALNGLRVLDIAQGWAGPLAARLLGELGADVVKIEASPPDWLRSVWPQGPRGHSQAFELANVQKRGVRLDHTRDDDDAERLRNLIRRSDAVIVDEAWIDSAHSRAGALDELQRLSPATVFCSITPYGLDGAFRDWPANDITLQALGGTMASTGMVSDDPTPVGPAIADHSAAHYASTAILAALEERRRSDLGQLIDLAVHDCLMNYLFLFLNPLFALGAAPPRLGNRHLTCAPWNAYLCRDGWVQICTSTNQQWQTIARLCGYPELANSPRFDSTANRLENIDEVDEIVSGWVAGRPVKEVLATLSTEGIPAEYIIQLEELLKDPQFLARKMLVELDVPDGGSVWTSGTVYKLSKTPGRVDRPAPLLGEHTGDVLNDWLREIADVPPKRGRRNGKSGGCLDGILVVELGVYGAGPYCGRLLAELGAEVVKVEPPDGDPIRHFLPLIHGHGYAYHCYNLNKQGVTLDLKDPSDLARLLRLIARADIFLENLAPEAVERIGIGHEELCSRFPGLVYCSVSGFGRSGPYSGRRAYDTTIQAASGIMALTGRPEQGPTKCGLSIADLMTPTAAAAGILAALHHRHLTGRGQHVDLSMMDVMAWSTQAYWPGFLFPADSDGAGWAAERKACPSGVYAVRDGLIAVSVDTDIQWRALADLMGLGSQVEALNGGSRLARRNEVELWLAAWLKDRPLDDAMTACRGSGVPVAPVLEIADVVATPQVTSRNLIVEVPDHRGRPLRVVQSAFRMSATSGRVVRGGPAQGEHNHIFLQPSRAPILDPLPNTEGSQPHDSK